MKEFQVEIVVRTVYNINVIAESKEEAENTARDQYDSGVYEESGEIDSVSFEVFDNNTDEIINDKVIVDGVIAIKLANGKFIPFIKRCKYRNKDNTFHWCWFNIEVLKKHKVLIECPEELADCWRLEPYYHISGEEITQEWMMKALHNAFDNPISFVPGTIRFGYLFDKVLVPKSETELLTLATVFTKEQPVLMWKEDKWSQD